MKRIFYLGSHVKAETGQVQAGEHMEAKMESLCLNSHPGLCHPEAPSSLASLALCWGPALLSGTPTDCHEEQ